jgi:hypothetical protein
VRGRREGEADVRVGKLRAQTLAACERDLTMVESELRQVLDGMPGRVRGHARIDVGGHEPEGGSGDHAPTRVSVGVAARLELLQVGELTDVHLGREVAPNRLLERLIGREVASRQGPGAERGFPGALPQEDLQALVRDLKDDRERLVFGRVLHRLST